MATLTLLRSLKWSHRRYVASVQAFVTHTSRCVTDLTLYRLAVAVGGSLTPETYPTATPTATTQPELPLTISPEGPIMNSLVAEQDLLSPELTADPHGYFADLRANDPVHWNSAARAWLVTGYQDVCAGYLDPLLSSDRVRPILDVVSPARREALAPMLNTIGSWMVVTDAPAHTRLRKLANNAFRQQHVAAMAGWIGELTDELLQDFVTSGGSDFLSDIAYPLPATVIARMMGAPKEDRRLFQEWSDELALVAFGAGGEARADRHQRALAGVQEMQSYLADLIDDRRRSPGDDMISLLVGAEGDDALTEPELLALCALILFAGHETTTNLLCNAMVTLTDHPDDLAALQADPGAVNKAVEEVLRFEGPIKILTRWVFTEHERGGRTIKAGDRVLLINQSANRDATVFPVADTFDMQRGTQPLHVGFGRGAHACLGAQLARVEARVALPKLLDKLPGLHVTEPVKWKPSLASRAVDGLTVGYRRGEPAGTAGMYQPSVW